MEPSRRAGLLKKGREALLSALSATLRVDDCTTDGENAVTDPARRAAETIEKYTIFSTAS